MLMDELAVAADAGFAEYEKSDLLDVDFVEAAAPVRAQPEVRTFGIPPIIWGSMAASYVLFFGGLLIGTGHDGLAIFAIVVSVLYTLMFFGTAYVLNGVGSTNRKGQLSQWVDGKFQTHTGPMSFGSVYGQMLVVPIMIGLWGVAIAIIRFAIM